MVCRRFNSGSRYQISDAWCVRVSPIVLYMYISCTSLCQDQLPVEIKVKDKNNDTESVLHARPPILVYPFGCIVRQFA